jgi:aconitate hydratase
MTRGTFANVRIKNLMVLGVEGGVTLFQPSGEQMSIFDASTHYQSAGIPLVVFAGQNTEQAVRATGPRKALRYWA